ncbi:hypothetical protein OpiT1DRAFT_02538 [Opitutaceae bacterium TAV1]|nr:hypothetical protein OpiT1DRAFT_02538 [Opitutaceae bacterium TAV1]
MSLIDKTCGELIEEWTPYIVPLFIGGFIGYHLIDSPIPKKIDNLIEASINIFSILVGFVGAALAIILAIENKPVINRLKRDQKYKRFIRYFFESCISAFLALSAAFVFNVFSIEMKSAIWKVVIVAWLIVVMMAALLCLRVTWLLFRVLNANSILEENSS